MDTIKAMKAFAAVARHRSFTKGANALGLSLQVTSKYVAQLEAKFHAHNTKSNADRNGDRLSWAVFTAAETVR